MRLLFTILIFLSFKANATNYYLDNSGSDGNNGTSSGTAWQTISKVNSFTSFGAGDSILLKCDGIWNESLRIQSSGVVGNPIVISSYGVGTKPLITGFQTLTGLTNTDNIWAVTATNSVANLNTVLIDGTISAKGRYPNTGYSTILKNVYDSVIIVNTSALPDLTGVNVVLKSSRYTIDISPIKARSGDTITLLNKTTYRDNIAGYGFFLQNAPQLLDTLREWCYDSVTKVFSVYSDESPNVQISTIDTLVYLSKKTDIVFYGLQFNGANSYAIRTDSSSRIRVENCYFNNTGNTAILGSKTDSFTIKNDSILNSLSNAIYLREVDQYLVTQNTCDTPTVIGNYILKSGMIPGMGQSHNGQYNAITTIGKIGTISRNRIDSTGYLGIIWNGKTKIENNYITHSLLVKAEGAAIYNFGVRFDYNYSTGSIVRKNILTHTVGNKEGVTGNEFVAAGVYMDAQAEGILIDSNFILGGSTAAVYYNDGRSDDFVHNTIVTNEAGVYYSPLGGNGLNQNNIILITSTDSACIWYGYGIPPPYTSIDSNIYLRPSNQTDIMRRTSATYTLSQWKSTYPGFDVHSKELPVLIDPDQYLVYYNPTFSDSTITLPYPCYDAYQHLYNNSITINPFGSAVLFKAVITKPKRFRIATLNFSLE